MKFSRGTDLYSVENCLNHDMRAWILRVSVVALLPQSWCKLTHDL